MPAPGERPTQTLALISEMGRLRHSLAPMRAAPVRLVRAEGRLLVLERSAGAQTVRAYFNAGDQAVGLFDLAPGARLLLAPNDPSATPRAPLPPCAARLFLLHGAW